MGDDVQSNITITILRRKVILYVGNYPTTTEFMRRQKLKLHSISPQQLFRKTNNSTRGSRSNNAIKLYQLWNLPREQPICETTQFHETEQQAFMKHSARDFQMNLYLYEPSKLLSSLLCPYSISSMSLFL